MSLSTWNSHSPCERCFFNLPQGMWGIQMELPAVNFYSQLLCIRLKEKINAALSDSSHLAIYEYVFSLEEK